MNVNQDLHQGEMLLLNVNVYKNFLELNNLFKI